MSEPEHSEAADLAAIIEITPVVLAAALQLPPGSYVDCVDSPHDRPGVLLMRLRGAGWPVKPGERIPQASAMVNRYYGEDGALIREVFNWGLSERQKPQELLSAAALKSQAQNDEKQRCPACGDHSARGVRRLECNSCGSLMVTDWDRHRSSQIDVLLAEYAAECSDFSGRPGYEFALKLARRYAGSGPDSQMRCVVHTLLANIDAERERYAPLMQAVEWLLEDGHMNQEHLASLRAAWEAVE